MGSKQKQTERLRESISKKKSKLKEMKGNLILKYTNGDISKEEYDIAVELLDKNMKENEMKLIQLGKQENIKEIQKSVELVKKQLKVYIEFEEITRETINRFVRKIVVYDSGEIEIHYRFADYLNI